MCCIFGKIITQKRPGSVLRANFVLGALIFWACSSMLLTLSCANSGNIVGGGGTDTEVYGALKTHSGTDVGNGIITLLPESYNAFLDGVPDAAYWETTDPKGSFSFSISKPGTYTLYSTGKKSGESFYQNSLQVGIDTVSDV